MKQTANPKQPHRKPTTQTLNYRTSRGRITDGRTRVQAEYLYGRERAEFPDAKAHDVRDRSDGDRHGRVRQRPGQTFRDVHGNGCSSPRG